MSYVFAATYFIWVLSSALFSNTSTLPDSFPAVLEIGRVVNAFVMLALIVMVLITVGRERIITIGLILFAGVVLIASVGAGSRFLLTNTLFVIAATKALPRRSVQALLLALVLSLVVLLTLSYAGLIENVERHRLTGGGYAMGFSHPNAFSLVAFEVICCWVYLRWQSLSWVDVGGSALFAYAVFLVSDSRSLLLCGGAFLLVICCLRLAHGNAARRRVTKAAFLVLAFMVAFFVMAPVLFDQSNPVFQWANSLASHRLVYISQFYESTDLSMFGQPLQALSADNSTASPLDNAFVRLLLESGILCSLFVALILLFVLKRLFEREDYAALSVMLGFLLYGLFEASILFLFYNFSMLFVATALLPSFHEQGDSHHSAASGNRLLARKGFLALAPRTKINCFDMGDGNR